MMKSKAAFLGYSILSLSLVATARAATEQVSFDQSTGSTTFHAVGHPSALKINGTGASPKGNVAIDAQGKITGDLTLDLDSLDTGISTRTNHMKEKYLEVPKFPQAKLTLSNVSVPAADVGKDFSESNVPFQGTLLLHGVSKPVTGTAKIEQTGGKATVHAEFSVKISDYSISLPSFAGITVADDVTLVIDASGSAKSQ